MRARAHVVVRGMVQGVGFRYFVLQHAHDLGLSGSVRNVPGGEVEIEAEGDRSLVEEFLKAVKIGPRASRVNGVAVDWVPCTNSASRFEIR